MTVVPQRANVLQAWCSTLGVRSRETGGLFCVCVHAVAVYVVVLILPPVCFSMPISLRFLSGVLLPLRRPVLFLANCRYAEGMWSQKPLQTGGGGQGRFGVPQAHKETKKNGTKLAKEDLSNKFHLQSVFLSAVLFSSSSAHSSCCG